MQGLTIPDSASGVLFLFVGLLGWYIKQRAEAWLAEQAELKRLEQARVDAKLLEDKREQAAWVEAYKAQHEAQLAEVRADKLRLAAELAELRARRDDELEQWRSLAQDSMLALKRLSHNDTVALARRARSLEGHSLPGLSLDELSNPEEGEDEI